MFILPICSVVWSVCAPGPFKNAHSQTSMCIYDRLILGLDCVSTRPVQECTLTNVSVHLWSPHIGSGVCVHQAVSRMHVHERQCAFMIVLYWVWTVCAPGAFMNAHSQTLVCIYDRLILGLECVYTRPVQECTFTNVNVHLWSSYIGPGLCVHQARSWMHIRKRQCAFMIASYCVWSVCIPGP